MSGLRCDYDRMTMTNSKRFSKISPSNMDKVEKLLGSYANDLKVLIDNTINDVIKELLLDSESPTRQDYPFFDVSVTDVSNNQATILWDRLLQIYEVTNENGVDAVDILLLLLVSTKSLLNRIKERIGKSLLHDNGSTSASIELKSVNLISLKEGVILDGNKVIQRNFGIYIRVVLIATKK